MQVTSEVFEKGLSEGIAWEEQVFIFCEFKGIHGEGLHVTSAFLDSTFRQCDIYWALFNIATFVGIKFHGCDFRGCSFSGCRFVECEFEDCRFLPDNLNGSCSFDDSRWYGCTQRRTEGLSTEFASV